MVTPDIALCPHGQIALFGALKTKYPTGCHAPRLDCPRCHGTGERAVKPGGEYDYLIRDAFVIGGTLPCACLWVTVEDLARAEDHWQQMVLAAMQGPNGGN